MAQENLIDVVVHPANEDVAAIEFEDVNYISFVSSPGGAGEGTYGIPALLADDKVKREGLPAKILYVNPHRITAMHVTRKA
jgi:hypothetical protein